MMIHVKSLAPVCLILWSHDHDDDHHHDDDDDDDDGVQHGDD